MTTVTPTYSKELFMSTALLDAVVKKNRVRLIPF
ncbi:TPA: MFS transporter, partial [Escherichia coli]|nr:MFS transporter [Escherichia coli]